ncbi:MFS transporter [Bacillus wiedmannii]|uniref:MFS transporter n=1 Tax=Bacillus wiedmannii TaxID=1890302 RepID=UPI003D996133
MKSSVKHSLFANRNFSLFFFGQSLSTIGDGFQQIAIIYLIFDMGGRGSEMAFSQLSLFLPRIMILLLGGVVVDRLNAKQIIWITDLFRFAIISILVLLLAFDSLTFPLLYILLSLSGLASGFFYPAFNSIVPSLVEVAELERANAWVQSISQTAIFIGPPLAGVVISNFGVTTGFIINGFSYLIACLTGILIKNKEIIKDKMKESHIIKDLSNGFQQVWNAKWLRTILIVNLLGGLAVVGPLQIILPLYSKEVLKISTSQMGIVMAAFGIGSVLGMMMISKLKTEYKTLQMFYILEISQGIILCFVAIPSLIIVIFAIGIVGILNGIASIIMISKIQSNVPSYNLGRTMSFVSLASFGAVPISQLLSGWLSGFIPLNFVFIFSSGLLLISGFFGVIVSKKDSTDKAKRIYDNETIGG